MVKITQVFFVVFLALTLVLTQKNGDESKPYEFGFTVDGQQHRHEKKDVKGIIEGEFGFITADGVYHVTVYATDENGKFKILSMKNIRISAPLDGSPLRGEISPDAEKYRKKAGLPPLSQAETPSKTAPNPLAIPPKAPQQTVNTTPKSEAPFKFTTQPTLKPACASCGFITTQKPKPGQPGNGFQFQNPVFHKQDQQKQPVYPAQSGAQGPSSLPASVPLSGSLQNRFGDSDSTAPQGPPKGQSFVGGQSRPQSNLPSYQTVTGPQNTHYNSFGGSSSPGSGSPNVPSTDVQAPYYSGGNGQSPNGPGDAQYSGGGGQTSQNPSGNIVGSEYPSQEQGSQYPSSGSSQDYKVPNGGQGSLLSGEGVQVTQNSNGLPQNGNGGSGVVPYPNQEGNIQGQYPQYPNNGFINPQYPNNGFINQGSLLSGEGVQGTQNSNGLPQNGNGGSGVVPYPNQEGNVQGQYPQYPNNGFINPQYPNNGVGGSGSFGGSDSFGTDGPNYQEGGPNPNPLQLNKQEPSKEVSSFPPVSVSNGVIHVGGNKQQSIPIKDKFPGMQEGLPEGIDEKDITDLLYKFHYTVGFHGHYEKGLKNGAKVGGYFVNGRDGISRVVTYVADENGYRPKVKFINLGLSSDETPKPETEKTFGLKSFEFVWYPVE